MSHTRGTFAALVDAVIPETPALEDRGEEHVPGRLAVGLDETLVEALNNQQSADESPLAWAGYDTVPYSPIVATLLDFAALELLVRRDNEESTSEPDERFADGRSRGSHGATAFVRLNCSNPTGSSHASTTTFPISAS